MINNLKAEGQGNGNWRVYSKPVEGNEGNRLSFQLKPEAIDVKWPLISLFNDIALEMELSEENYELFKRIKAACDSLFLLASEGGVQIGKESFNLPTAFKLDQMSGSTYLDEDITALQSKVDDVNQRKVNRRLPLIKKVVPDISQRDITHDRLLRYGMINVEANIVRRLFPILEDKLNNDSNEQGFIFTGGAGKLLEYRQIKDLGQTFFYRQDSNYSNNGTIDDYPLRVGVRFLYQMLTDIVDIHGDVIFSTPKGDTKISLESLAIATLVSVIEAERVNENINKYLKGQMQGGNDKEQVSGEAILLPRGTIRTVLEDVFGKGTIKDVGFGHIPQYWEEQKEEKHRQKYPEPESEEELHRQIAEREIAPLRYDLRYDLTSLKKIPYGETSLLANFTISPNGEARHETMNPISDTSVRDMNTILSISIESKEMPERKQKAVALLRIPDGKSLWDLAVADYSKIDVFIVDQNCTLLEDGKFSGLGSDIFTAIFRATKVGELEVNQSARR